jgi:hypothetical protein
VFTNRKFDPAHILTGEWQKDGPVLIRILAEYFGSLETPHAIRIGKALVDDTPIGSRTPSSGAFTTLSVSTSSAFPTSSTTPVPTATVGAFTTVASTVIGQKVGNRFMFTCIVTITTNNTAAGAVLVGLPYTPAENTGMGGSTTGGVGLAGLVRAASSDLYIVTSAGAYPGADGVVLSVSGSYRV